MKNHFKGKIAVISGATSGIGKAIGAKLQAHGVKIINVSKDDTPTNFFKNYVCNIADESQLIAVVDDVKRTFGKIDFLFCNAGMGMVGSVENAKLSNIDTLFNVNLIAHAKMTKLLIPIIKDGGKIIYTGSFASIVSVPYQACYSASKSAIQSFSRALAKELKPRKIKVCTIMPGDIVSGFTVARLVSKGDSTREQKSIEKATRAELTGKSPDVVANTVFRILQKKNPPLRVSVGFGNKLLALLVKLLPIRLTDFLVNKIYCDDSTK